MATLLRSTEPDPHGDHDKIQVTIELDCGCTVKRVIDQSRLLTDDKGERFVAGKFICELHGRGKE